MFYHIGKKWCVCLVCCVSVLEMTCMHFQYWCEFTMNHLFLGIVSIPLHAYSSTYTRTIPPALEFVGISYGMHYGSRLSISKWSQGVQRGLLRFASARTRLCQMRKVSGNAMQCAVCAVPRVQLVCPWKPGWWFGCHFLFSHIQV